MRIALGIEYNGLFYHGWQRQKNGLPTVQGHLEAALSYIADHVVAVVASGRTDAGVHATQQVVHFESNADRALQNWIIGTNSKLPPTIRVVWAQPVSEQFHARFSARSRRYCYHIYPHHVPPAVLHGLVTWDRREFDVAKMQQAGECLIGTHDFTSFRAAMCQAHHPTRTVQHLRISRQGALILIDIQANAFLHHMVRNIAGVLMRIGAGEQPISWCETVLEAKDRRMGGITAPSAGLYFIHASYPDCPEITLEPRFPIILN